MSVRGAELLIRLIHAHRPDILYVESQESLQSEFIKVSSKKTDA
jgi:hypothetical protein